ncbi:MAG: VOC family protein [Verrucomicrobia bacterium]|nr:VOC family protein [Verrucomicrobiota bacterium]
MPAVQHIAFVCRNRIVMERFYAKYFGFERARVFNAGEPGEFVMTRLGSVCIEFFQASPQAIALAARTPRIEVGFKHLAFEVPQLEPVVEVLKRDGVDVGEIFDCSDVSPGLRAAFFHDPEGYQVEILENWADDADPPALREP